MMSAFFNFQPTLNKLFNNFIFLKYYGGIKLTPPPKKNTFKKPSLFRIKKNDKGHSFLQRKNSLF